MVRYLKGGVNLLVFSVLICVISQRVMDKFNQNLYAIQAFQLSYPALGDAAWVTGRWWQTLCNIQAHQDESNLLRLDEDRIDSLHLKAVLAIARGDCEQALVSLVKTSATLPTEPHNIIKSYISSMLGQWTIAAEAYPTDQIPVGNWVARRYWANVLLRAGLEIGDTDPVRGAQLFQKSDALAGIYPSDTSLELARFLQKSGHLRDGLREMWYVTASLDEADAWDMEGEYSHLLSNYLAQQSDTVSHSYVENAFSADASNIQPQYEVQYQWDDNWTLKGFDFATKDLVQTPFIEVTFHWRYSEPTTGEQAVTMITAIRNLMPDAGFQFLPAAQGLRPPGYIGGLYGEAPPYPYNSVEEETGRFFCLTDDQRYESSGVMTAWFDLPDVSDSRLLIQGGMFRTEETGRAHIGWRWRSADESGFGHIVNGQSATVWTKGVGVVEPPIGAEQIAFHLLKYQSKGDSCFDNVFAFFLPVPHR
jgi:hypothetical protein